MELPTFDNSIPRNRFAPARSAPACSANTETEAPFAHLFVRREGSIDSNSRHEDESNASATEGTASAEPPSKPRPDDIRKPDPDEPHEAECPTAANATQDATADTHSQPATAPSTESKLEPAERASTDNEQMADVPTLPQNQADLRNTEPARSPSRDASPQAPTQPIVAPKLPPSAKPSAEPSALPATSETTAEPPALPAISETTAKATPDTTSEAGSEVTAESAAKSTAEAAAEPAAKSKAEAAAEPAAKSKAEAAAEPAAKSKAEAAAEPVAKSKAEAAAEPAAKSKAEAAAEPAAKSKAESTSKASADATPKAAVNATAEAPAAPHDGGADGVQTKQRQPRTSQKAGRNEKALRNPGPGQGNQTQQVITGAVAATDAAGNLTERPAEQHATTDNRGHEANSETVELRTLIDQHDRPASPGDRTAEQMRTRVSARSEDNHEISQIDRTRLLQRVARAIHTAPLRGGVIRLRLRPPELGSLHLEVSMEKGVLRARLQTETQMARSVLLENLPQLRERLIEQGIRIEQFDIDVSQQDTGQSQQQADQAQDRSAAFGLRSSGANREESRDDQVSVPEATRIINPKSLNVVI